MKLNCALFVLQEGIVSTDTRIVPELFRNIGRKMATIFHVKYSELCTTEETLDLINYRLMGTLPTCLPLGDGFHFMNSGNQLGPN